MFATRNRSKAGADHEYLPFPKDRLIYYMATHLECCTCHAAAQALQEPRCHITGKKLQSQNMYLVVMGNGCALVHSCVLKKVVEKFEAKVINPNTVLHRSRHRKVIDGFLRSLVWEYVAVA